MEDPISVSQAAKALALSPARVRAMAVGGQLCAAKLGDRWFVERAAVEQRNRNGSPEGRRFSPRNALALLLLASGEEVEEIDSSVRSRLKRALRLEGLEGLALRLAHRAEVVPFKAHPGEIPYLLADPAFVRSGVSAAGDHGFGLVSGREADGYLQAGESSGFVARHAMEPAGIDGNVRLRLVPQEAWHFLEGRKIAPEAAVALDLAGEPDPRSARAGQTAIRNLDRRRGDRRASPGPGST